MAEGDLETVVSLLHPDVTLTGDSNGKVSTAINVIHGAEKVARFMFGLARRYGPAMFTSYQLGLVNGELGGYTAGSRQRRVPGDDAADHGHDGARRKSLRAMGYRQPRQVQRLPAARLNLYSGPAESQCSRGLAGRFGEPAPESDHVEIPVGQVGLAAQCHWDSACPQLVRICFGVIAERSNPALAI